MYTKLSAMLLFIAILSGISGTAISDNQKVYTFGVVPQFEAKKLRKIWKPIFKQLETETGFKFKMRGAASIPAFEKEFLAGKFHFSYMNPFHLLIANESQGYIPLIRDHGKKLQGVLVARKDGPIKSVKDLDNKTLAFPSPNALGASLQMRAELHDKFKLNITPNYVKTHDSVYLNVYLNQAAAGGGVAKTLGRQATYMRNNFNIIHKTTPVAPHPIAAHPSVPKADRIKVQQAFIKMAATEKGKKLLSKIPVKTMGPASMEDYKSLEKMNLKRFYVAD